MLRHESIHAVRRALERRIVDRNEFRVARKVKIRFDETSPQFDRASKRCQCVLRRVARARDAQSPKELA